MFGFNKLFGLDIGNGAIKSCELSVSSRKAKINNMSFVKTDPGSFKNGEILNAKILEKAIQKVQGKIKTKKVSIGIGGSSVMVKKITLPRMDIALLPEQVRWEAEQYIPFNIDEVNIDYIVLESKASSDTMDLLLVAAQQNKVGQYIELLAQLKLKTELVDVSSFALANCFLFNYPSAKQATVGLIDIGAFFTHLVILKNGEIVFCRDIPSGGCNFDEELAKNLGIPEDEAVQIKESGASMPDVAVDTLKSAGRRYADQLIGAIEFFTETTENVNVEKFYVTGGGSLTPGLMPLIGESLKKPVQFMDILQNITPSSSVLKRVSAKDLQYRSAVALGLALRSPGDQK